MSSTIGTNSLSDGAGLDVGATVDQLIYTEQAPERLLQAQQSTLSAQSAALRDINSRLESLESSVNELKDLTGVFGDRTVDSSNQSVVTAAADSTAALGAHSITISQLATISSQYSDALASPTTTFATGALQFQLGGGAVKTINFNSTNNTLTGAANYINTLGLGINASVVTDAVGSRLSLVSTTSGAAGDITVVSAPAGLQFHVGVTGQNAKLTVDGVPVQCATNQVTGVLTGVTMNLTGTTTADNPVSLTVAQDTDKASQAIHDMVSAYNSVINNINAQFTYNASTGSAGTLAGSSSLRALQSSLLSTMSYRTSDKTATYQTLRSIGIQMQDDGTLKIDDTQLTTALQKAPADVERFFQGASLNGFANQFGSQLMSLTDSVDGPLLVDAKGIDNSVSAISDQIDQFEVRIALRRQVLTDQYTKIDTMLRQLPLLQQQISAQLGSLK